jgi:micrococcal nuclease
MISERKVLTDKTREIFLILLLNSIIFLFFLNSCGIYYYDDYRSDEATFTDGKISGKSPDLYTVDEVIDGDTFSINTGEMVRMLGINTPEIERYYYHEARDMLSIITMGQQVRLEKDITDRDQYGRLLRYVFIGDLFVNLEMVKRGFANVYTLPPDIKYVEELLEGERYARENYLGLWSKPQENYNIGFYLQTDAEGNDTENLNGEYLILSNASGTIYNIDGWTVKDSGTSIYEFDRFIFLEGAEIYLFTGKGADGDGLFYWNSRLPVWNNDHDSLFLRDSEGMLIIFYRY